MMTLQQVAQWVAGAQLVGDGGVAVLRVHTDTRTLQAGDLFVALKGERFDANDFLAEARAKGAVAAICYDEAALRAAGLPGVVVADSKLALGQLAAGWRTQFKLPLIAVTGSNGKTTVTQMIAAILRAYCPQAMLATEGNLNNEIGVPLTVLRLRPGHELAVVELGMNHPGEIAVLAAIAQPTVALVNNAQREHQEFMATIEAVARENGAVIEALAATGTAVFPADDTYSALWHDLSGTRPQLTFALTSDTTAADLSCAAPQWANNAWQIQAHTPAGPLAYTLQVAGLHNVKNSLAAAACALAAGVPLADIARGLEAFEPVKGRSRALAVELAGRTITLVDDSYNANPDSVRAAIDVLAGLPGPRLLVLGDMGEVGSEGPRFHAEVGAYARERGVEMLFGLGEQAAVSVQHFSQPSVQGCHFTDIETLNTAVLSTPPDLRSVLVKGSRFMRMERVVQAITACAQQNKEPIHAA
ncbi:UDP-N-acetylmuramoyl-tripeptide--D-alanyl-D-alanine ligase [Curvibacter delicatus]|uniref:UDP-N-acetylmuramoyl-tripeptide--D-alanyl-D- alanine ligase n=1 Tax=Curvibacter delicatus TaxID=80879 RepID=UPI0009FCF4E5|nr:UDP-N-acetylmuramoyl-tripeptide--D-alanyl-D-alanine ligase [Curvibacter delicatus]